MITDAYLRTIRCLRVSVTNMCNLRCVYCMPQKGFELMKHDEILTFEEITTVVRHAVRLGIDNIRLTGGEPLVRKNVQSLISMLLSVDGISSITMTTNGTLLKRYAAILRQNGLSRLNISLDTLNEKKFAEITRGGNIKDVFDGIDEALKVGFKNTKINVVVMRGINDCELRDFARLTLDKELEVRFIELMTSGAKSMAEEGRFVPTTETFRLMQDVGRLITIDTQIGYGPARMYKIKGAIGTIGFISPVSEPFCGNCNRLRLTSDGKLRSCLLRGGEVDIKDIIRARQDDTVGQARLNDKVVGRGRAAYETSQTLEDAFRMVSTMKPVSHSGSGVFEMQHIGG